MFDHTRAALQKIQTDFRIFVHRFTLASQILYIVYLIYMLGAGVGMLWANIVLLAISVAYFVIFLLATSARFAKKLKKLKRVSNKIYTRTKLIIKLFTLGVTLYGIYAATSHVTAFSIILTTLSIIAWILQVLFHIILTYVIDRFNLIKEGFSADFEGVSSVGNFFKKVTGKEVAPKAEKSKHRLWLEGKVEENKLLKKQEKRQEKQRKKEIKRGNRKDRKNRKRAAEQETTDEME